MKYILLPFSFIGKALLLIPIYFYKILISPLLPKGCKFTPTCSNYAVQAVKEYGCIKGGFLFLRRIVKCTPKSKGGYDPVTPNIKGNIKWVL